jgi:hypothetical protein
VAWEERLWVLVFTAFRNDRERESKRKGEGLAQKGERWPVGDAIGVIPCGSRSQKEKSAPRADTGL